MEWAKQRESDPEILTAWKLEVTSMGWTQEPLEQKRTDQAAASSTSAIPLGSVLCDLGIAPGSLVGHEVGDEFKD